MKPLNWLALALFAAWTCVIAVGCVARPMICVPVRVGGAPALGCVDSSTVDERITPYEVPSPDFTPDSKPGMVPWREKHGDKVRT